MWKQLGVLAGASCFAVAVGMAACGGGANGSGGDDAGGGDDALADGVVSEAASDVAPGPAICVSPPTPTPFPTGSCFSNKPSSPDALDEALGTIGLDRCTVGFDPKQVPYSGWNLNDPLRLPDTQPLLLHPLRLPAYGRETAKFFDNAMASDTPVSNAIAAAAIRHGVTVGGCVLPSDDADPSDASPLASAVADGAKIVGGSIDSTATIAALSTVPIELQRALAPVVRALARSHADVMAMRAAYPAATLSQMYRTPSYIIGTTPLYPLSPTYQGVLKNFDIGKMAAAAERVTFAIERAKLSRFAGVDFKAVDLPTPFGALVLHGVGIDKYMPGTPADDAALLLDTGGNDDYRVAAGGSTMARPISVAIDLGGDDRYGYVEKPNGQDGVGERLPSDGAGRTPATSSRVARQGAGVWGVGILMDLGKGKDTYRSLAVSQGVGVFGVGAQYDDGGDDDYAIEALGQGAAGFGIGLHLDMAGNDKRLAYVNAQGFGYTRGVGVAWDGAGDDSWRTDPGDPTLGGDPIYSSAQLPGTSNASMSQGCGEGRRADTTPEGVGLIGGMGILRDAAGKDTYVTSVFGQGSAFLGTGLFLEGGGDDTYEGLWYVQGSAAHLGITLFHEVSGNDIYNPTFPIAATSVGVGHDFSASVHLDEAGDDDYHAPGLSLGSGNDNGFGLLMNVGGSDHYAAGGNPTMGGAWAGDVGASRGAMLTFGIFVRAGGASTFKVAGGDVGRVGGTWGYAPGNGDGDGGPGDAGMTETGVLLGPAKAIGVDRPSGTASLP